MPKIILNRLSPVNEIARHFGISEKTLRNADAGSQRHLLIQYYKDLKNRK